MAATSQGHEEYDRKKAVLNLRLRILKKFGALLLFAIILILCSTLVDYKHELKNWYTDPHVYSTLLRELGFAFIIAGLVAVIIELSAKTVEMMEDSIQKERVSRDVLEALIGYRFPAAVKQMAITTFFGSPIMRENLKVNIEILPLPKDIPIDSVIAGNFVLLDISLRYTLQNTSSSSSKNKIGTTVPMSRLPQADSFLKPYFVKLGDGDEIDECDVDGICKIDQESFLKKYFWERDVNPDNPRDVHICYRVLRQIDDSFVWKSAFCSTDLEVVVLFRSGERKVMVEAIHNGEMKEKTRKKVEDGYEITYKSTVPLLPNQGFLLWWHRPIAVPEKAESTLQAG
jgi:hypothetical protein